MVKFTTITILLAVGSQSWRRRAQAERNSPGGIFEAPSSHSTPSVRAEIGGWEARTFKTKHPVSIIFSRTLSAPLFASQASNSAPVKEFSPIVLVCFQSLLPIRACHAAFGGGPVWRAFEFPPKRRF